MLILREDVQERVGRQIRADVAKRNARRGFALHPQIDGGHPVTPGEHRLLAGDVELDELRHVVRVGDRFVDLSAREFALLGYLMRHPGQVLTRQQILDAVWGAEPDVYSNVVDLYVHYLRRKLAELGREGLLRTVRGVGYTLRPAG